MSAKQHDKDHAEKVTLGDDLLYGADAIAKFLKRKPRWVYHQQAHPGTPTAAGNELCPRL